ncbi:hypothetical protein ACTU44_11860 [Thalassospira sp. SM2505]
MKQIMAAVPIPTDDTMIELYPFGRAARYIHSSKCTLTRDQIAAMAEARFNSKQAHIKEFSGLEGPKWSEIDPDTMELEKRDMIAAVTAAGFEISA